MTTTIKNYLRDSFHDVRRHVSRARTEMDLQINYAFEKFAGIEFSQLARRLEHRGQDPKKFFVPGELYRLDWKRLGDGERCWFDQYDETSKNEAGCSTSPFFLNNTTISNQSICLVVEVIIHPCPLYGHTQKVQMLVNNKMLFLFFQNSGALHPWDRFRKLTEKK